LKPSFLIENDFVKEIEYGFEERVRVQQQLNSDPATEREWHDIMDGDLYRNLLKPLGFLANRHNLSMMFSTDGVHVFKASHDEIWPLLVVINELHPSIHPSVR
jgi:hypothetical protein